MADEMYDAPLPNGWRWATIFEIALSMKNGIYKPPEYYSDAGIACLRMYNIEGGKIAWKDIKRMNLTFDEIKEYGLEPGDILVNRVNSRELVGKSAIIPNGLESCVYESKNIRVRVRGADSRYVNYWFQVFSQAYFNRNAQQTVGMASINQKQLGAMPIPLPPLPEQQRIVANIDELFSQVEAGLAALRHVQLGLKRYKASVLKAACEGRLTAQDATGEPAEEMLRRLGKEPLKGDGLGMLPEGWCWAKVEDIAISMKNGVYKPAEYYAEDGIACLRMYNIEDGVIVWKDIKRMKLSPHEFQEYELQPGDILVNRVNSRELVGKSAVIPGNLEPMVYESKNIRLRVNLEVVDSNFVNYWFRVYSRQYFNFNAQQVVGMASINQTQLAAMPVPVAPLSEQLRIIAEVERRLSVAQEVEAVVAANMQRAGRLRRAVLKAAFEGRLVG